jgi:hypothetical protein
LKSAAEPSLDNGDESFSSAGASSGPHFLNYSISLNSLFGFLRLMRGARRARSTAATGPNDAIQWCRQVAKQDQAHSRSIQETEKQNDQLKSN